MYAVGILFSIKGKDMILRNKHSGEIIVVPSESYEIVNAYIIPEQCLYKKDYEVIWTGDKCIEEKKEKA